MSRPSDPPPSKGEAAQSSPMGPRSAPNPGEQGAQGVQGAHRLHGMLAEVSSAQRLVDALHAAREAGYRDIDAYSPFPIEEVCELVTPKRSKVPLLVFTGGALGGMTGYLMQTYSAVFDYPLNVGGRPLHSWPMFIPITFELTILGAGLFAVVGMLFMNRLPMPYHPVFNVPRFAKASRDGYFLEIEATDPAFDLERTRAFLEGLGADEVTDVYG